MCGGYTAIRLKRVDKERRFQVVNDDNERLFDIIQNEDGKTQIEMKKPHGKPQCIDLTELLQAMSNIAKIG